MAPVSYGIVQGFNLWKALETKCCAIPLNFINLKCSFAYALHNNNDDNNNDNGDNNNDNKDDSNNVQIYALKKERREKRNKIINYMIFFGIGTIICTPQEVM